MRQGPLGLIDAGPLSAEKDLCWSPCGPWPEGNLNCVDLFAGAGGFSLAARQASLTVRLAVEMHRHAAATYRHNLCGVEPKPVLVEKDIRTLNPAWLADAVFADGRSCDLILGGPPCQGFSTHRLNDAGVNDLRNDLVHVYFDFVRAFAPTAFLLENVPGMLWLRHQSVIERFYREGAEAGYDLKPPIVLDARNYGVPQRRKRVFILGVRRELGLGEIVWPPLPTHSGDHGCDRKSMMPAWVTCADVFLPAHENDPNDVHMSHREDLVNAFERTPANGGSRQASGRVLKCHEGHDGHSDVYGRIDPSEPAPTMTTACVNPSKGRFVHPTLHHGITVRQAARIQTFPDNFIFLGGLLAGGEQVGNAVPVKMGRQLIEHLKPMLTAARSNQNSMTGHDRRVQAC